MNAGLNTKECIYKITKTSHAIRLGTMIFQIIGRPSFREKIYKTRPKVPTPVSSKSTRSIGLNDECFTVFVKCNAETPTVPIR